MRSLRTKRKRWDSWEGEWGYSIKKRNEQESKTQMHSMKTKERTSKKEHVLHWERMRRWKAVVVGSLGVLWVSFSVPRCPSSVLTRFWLQSAGPCDSSCEDHFQDTGVTLLASFRKKQMPGMTVLPPTCPLMDHNLAVVKGLVELKETMDRSGRAT